MDQGFPESTTVLFFRTLASPKIPTIESTAPGARICRRIYPAGCTNRHAPGDFPHPRDIPHEHPERKNGA
jgi:hypothetical protein